MMSFFMNYLIVGVCMIPVIAAALLLTPRLSERFSARVPYLVFLILAIRLLLPWNVTLPEGASQGLTIGEAAFRLPGAIFDTLAGTSGQDADLSESQNAAGTSGEGMSAGVAGEVDVAASIGTGGTGQDLTDDSIGDNALKNSAGSADGSGNDANGAGDSENEAYDTVDSGSSAVDLTDLEGWFAGTVLFAGMASVVDMLAMHGVSAVSVLTVIWALGIAFFAIRYVVSMLRLEKGLKRWRKKPAESTISCIREVENEFHLRPDAFFRQRFNPRGRKDLLRKNEESGSTEAETAESETVKAAVLPEVWICPILSTPMVVGFFSPAIYLPHENYSSREMEMIFTHEMTHLRRHDIWYKLVLFAVRTLHWYNPFVWRLARRAMDHLEVSCDGDVVAERDSQYRKDYGAMLLREATCDLRFQNALTTCFSDGKKELKNRLEEVSNMKKRKRGMPLVLGALVIAVLAGSGFSYERAEGMEETEASTEAFRDTDDETEGQTDHSSEEKDDESQTENSSEEKDDEDQAENPSEEKHDEYQLPILDGALTWGMTLEEVTEVLGSPTESEENEFGGTYTWELDEPMKCALGDCSELVLSIGKENLTDASGEIFSQGLLEVDLVIDETTKETVLSSLESLYGEFSDESGRTEMEQTLKAANPDYFNEVYYCDAWKVENLEEEDYDRLCEIAEATSEWMGLKTPVAENAVLMTIGLSGIASEETYSCSVALSAQYLTYLKAGASMADDDALDENAEGQTAG